jgi:hypothetical protein
MARKEGKNMKFLFVMVKSGIKRIFKITRMYSKDMMATNGKFSTLIYS